MLRVEIFCELDEKLIDQALPQGSIEIERKSSKASQTIPDSDLDKR
jgi:hypothetical protein